MRRLACILLFIGLLLTQSVLWAQPFVSAEPLVEAASGALGLTILGNPSINIKSVDDFRNGVSLDHNTLKVSVTLGLSWSVQVRATGDLYYQNQSIPVSAIGMQSINLGNRPELFLSTTNQTLASGLASSALDVTNTIRYRTTGGSTFLKPGGNYTTTLLFTLTAN